MTADDESNSIVTIVPTSKLLNVLKVNFFYPIACSISYN